MALHPVTIHVDDETLRLIRALQGRGGHRSLAAMVSGALMWLNALRALRGLGYTEVHAVKPGTDETVKLIGGDTNGTSSNAPMP